MAEKKASFIIELQDKASAALNSLSGTVKNFKTSWLEVTAVTTAVVAEIYHSITAFAEQEASVMRLNQALKSTTSDSRGATERLTALGESLSKTTGFSNNTITAMQGLLASMGFNEAAIAQLTPRVLNMSRAFGMDASNAAMMLGKSIELGTSANLKRMGIVLDETAFKNRDFAKIMSEVDGKTRLAGETFGNTTAGKLEKFKNAIGELQEKIGEILAEAFMPLVELLTRSAEALQSYVGVIKIFTAEISLVGTFIMSTVRALGSLAAVVSLVFERNWSGAVSAAKQGITEWVSELDAGVQKASQKIEKAWSGMQDSFSGKEEKKKPNQKPGGKPNTPGGQAFDDDELAIKIAQLKGYNDLAERMQLDHELKLRNIAQNSAQAQALIAATLNKQKINAAKSTLDEIAKFSTAKNKELAIAGKAAAIGSAIIHTADAVTVALESAPPPFNFALAAAVGAAGAAQVATIAGVQFAEGGMVLPSSGGTLATIGEAGKAEAVVPLDDPKTKEKLRDTIGGGVTVQVGTLIADEVGIEEFARRLDKALFRLQRNRQTVAI